MAAGSDGSVAVAWDGYARGNYDVYLRMFRNGAWEPVHAVAASARFEANPTVAVDRSSASGSRGTSPLSNGVKTPVHP